MPFFIFDKKGRFDDWILCYFTNNFNGIMLGIQYAMVAVGFTLFRGVLNV